VGRLEVRGAPAFAPRTDSVGTFFQDLWTDLLTLPDFILAVLRHLVNRSAR
jgi:hypothetical protein